MEHEAKYIRLSPWRAAELLERAAGGASSVSLAEKYGVHRATVNRLIARYRDEAARRLNAKKRSRKLL